MRLKKMIFFIFVFYLMRQKYKNPETINSYQQVSTGFSDYAECTYIIPINFINLQPE